MTNETFIASAGIWGYYSYGFVIPRAVQKRLFKRNWKFVTLQIGRESVEINLTKAFWETCNELRNAKIKEWLVKRELHEWPYGKPTKVRISHLGGRKFKLLGVAS